MNNPYASPESQEPTAEKVLPSPRQTLLVQMVTWGLLSMVGFTVGIAIWRGQQEAAQRKQFELRLQESRDFLNDLKQKQASPPSAP